MANHLIIFKSSHLVIQKAMVEAVAIFFNKKNLINNLVRTNMLKAIIQLQTKLIILLLKIKKKILVRLPIIIITKKAIIWSLI